MLENYSTVPKYDWFPQLERSQFVNAISTRFPEINNGSGYALDLGCGTGEMPGSTRVQLENRGYRWVGLDLDIGRASMIADGHNLPFPSETFDFIVSIAAFEHMRKPWRVSQDLGRVVRPGGLFCGTTAFLEPQHVNSCFHMSHDGIESFLEEGGFELIQMWPGWNVLEAIPWFSLVEKGGRKQIFYEPARRLGLWADVIMRWLRTRSVASAMDCEEEKVVDQLRFCGSIGFIARKI